jgi:DNA-directed RNA polymerase specialized sigma24 family protein
MSGKQMSKVSLDELVQEANSSSRVGKAWIRIVESAVSGKVRNRPPRDYGFQEWNQEAIDDVVQEVFERRILNKGGLEYILAEATTTDHAHAGIHRLVGLALADMREPNVLNNIFDNLERRFISKGIALGVSTLSAMPTGYVVNEEEAEMAVRQIFLSQPRYPNRGTHRESAIFSPESFEEIVSRLITEVSPLTSSVIRVGLKRALTHLVSAEYYIDDARDFMEGADEGQSVEDEAVIQAKEFAMKVLNQLTPQSEKVFVALSYGVRSDTELAKALGLKARQTAKKWHDSMKEELFNSFETMEIPIEDQSEIVLAMRDLLGVLGQDSEEKGA